MVAIHTVRSRVTSSPRIPEKYLGCALVGEGKWERGATFPLLIAVNLGRKTCDVELYHSTIVACRLSCVTTLRFGIYITLVIECMKSILLRNPERLI